MKQPRKYRKYEAQVLGKVLPAITVGSVEWQRKVIREETREAARNEENNKK